MTDVIIEQESEQSTVTYKGEPGDADLFSHYVTKVALEQAILTGVPCLALCGKKWLPTRDAQKFPVCLECKDAFDALPDGP
jgi:hypothetical protein